MDNLNKKRNAILISLRINKNHAHGVLLLKTMLEKFSFYPKDNNYLREFLDVYLNSCQTLRKTMRDERNQKENNEKHLENININEYLQFQNILISNKDVQHLNEISYISKSWGQQVEYKVEFLFVFKPLKEIPEEYFGSIYYERIFSLISFLNLLYMPNEEILKDKVEKEKKIQAEKYPEISTKLKENKDIYEPDPGYNHIQQLYYMSKKITAGNERIYFLKKFMRECNIQFLKHEIKYEKQLNYYLTKVNKNNINNISPTVFHVRLGAILGDIKYVVNIAIETETENLLEILYKVTYTAAEWDYLRELEKKKEDKSDKN